jgi:hypothetical protein
MKAIVITTTLLLAACGVAASESASARDSHHRYHAVGSWGSTSHVYHRPPHARIHALRGNNAEGAGNNGNSFYGSNNLDNGNNFGSFR